MVLDVGVLKTWVGRQEDQHDQITTVPVAALSALLDRDEPPPAVDDILPPLWHWLYFLPLARQSDIGPDGHPKRGGFLPPVPLPRRMWAGGRLMFHSDLAIGEAIRRQSTIVDVSVKDGRTGPLVFVLVRHEISGPRGLAITEEHDIVYRDAPAAGEPGPPGRPALEDHVWQRDVVPDPVLLFRYSALTFNGHRIHYDRSYVTQEEGYPGLIVHGPLIATLLLDLVRRNTKQRISAFRFRALRPLFDTASFSVHAGTADALGRVPLWARDPAGFVAMEAAADLGPESAS
jgi:3-methylfumaryl-CoA hydratase